MIRLARAGFIMVEITDIFDVLSLLAVMSSVRLTAVLWREWPTLLSSPLTQHQKSRAEQAAYFIAVPVAVLVHELGHALAIWGYGGEVLEFHYRFFWGSVKPSFIGTPQQEWVISVAGTIGSLVVGLGFWLLFRSHTSPALRYFGLRALRFQIYFSLIFYPVFTLLGFEGDWKTIYNFWLTPLLSGLTAVFHASLLLLFWQLDRAGWFEQLSHETAEAQKKFNELETQVKTTPLTLETLNLHLRYLRALQQGGGINRASTELNKLLKAYPHSAEAHLEMATLLLQKQRQHVTPRAAQYAEKALQLGLKKPVHIASAYQLLGQRALESDRLEKAITEFTTALQTLEAHPASLDKLRVAHLYYLRSLASRRQNKYHEASLDIQKAITLAQETGHEQIVTYYREQLTVLEKHAGRRLDVSQSPSP